MYLPKSLLVLVLSGAALAAPLADLEARSPSGQDVGQPLQARTNEGETPSKAPAERTDDQAAREISRDKTSQRREGRHTVANAAKTSSLAESRVDGAVPGLNAHRQKVWEAKTDKEKDEAREDLRAYQESTSGQAWETR